MLSLRKYYTMMISKFLKSITSNKIDICLGTFIAKTKIAKTNFKTNRNYFKYALF